MDDFLRQDRHRVRFDWVRQGAAAVTVGADVAVVIDVLSFTTTLTVTLDRETIVLPYRWNDGGAVDYARQHDAVLAVGRSEATMGQVSLSPGTVRSARSPERLVLPSPNGSTIAHDLAENSVTCVGASFLWGAGAVITALRTHGWSTGVTGPVSVDRTILENGGHGANAGLVDILVAATNRFVAG